MILGNAFANLFARSITMPRIVLNSFGTIFPSPFNSLGNEFIILSINQIISKLGIKDYYKDENYKKFSNLCDSLFHKFKCNDNLKKLLLLFFNEKQYNEVFRLTFEEQKSEKKAGNGQSRLDRREPSSVRSVRSVRSVSRGAGTRNLPATWRRHFPPKPPPDR